MGDYGTEVRLLSVTGVPSEPLGTNILVKGLDEQEGLIEYAGRLCYANEDKLGARPGWIKDRIKAGHESILEHASMGFEIRCSRAVSHELVRHRIASYSQRSQRYVKENEPRYITPSEFLDEEKEVKASQPTYQYFHSYKFRLFEDAMRHAWFAYRELLKLGVKPEIARYVLPNACETQIITTMNFRELRHFIKLRTSPAALPEMREVAGKVRDICKEIAPEVFADV